MIDDAELLRRYADERDEDAFAQFVQRHLALVYGVAVRRLGGDVHGAADVAQHVFVAAVRHVRRLANHPGIAGWLYTAARNAAADHMRNEQRRRQREMAAEAERTVRVIAESDQTATADWAVVRPLIDEVLDELAEHDREAVLLRFFEGRTFGEVGRRLQLTENAARMRVERGVDKLQGLLARRGITSSSAAIGTALTSHALTATPAGLAASVTSSVLASAGTLSVAGAAAGLFAIMNTTKIVSGVALVIAALGVGTAIHQGHEAQNARADLRLLRAEHEQLRNTMRHTAARSKSLGQSGSANNAPLSAPQTKSGASAVASTKPIATPAEAPTNPSNAPVNSGMEYWGHPEYPRLSTLKLKAEIGLRYRALYRLLELSPQQIEQFEANRLAGELATMEVMSSAVATGVSVRDPSVVKLASDAARGLEMELSNILGREGHREFNRFRSARPVLDFVTSLAGNLSLTPAPLTAAQGETLTRLAMDSVHQVPSPTNPSIRRMENDWTSFAVGAEKALTGPQLATFRTMLSARDVQQQIIALQAATRNPSTVGSKPEH